MDLILENNAGESYSLMVPYNLDLSIGGTNDFELELDPESLQLMKNIGIGTRIYVPGEEYGGIVSDVRTSTSTNKIFLRGLTWRGILAKHIIIPPNGEDYYVTPDYSYLHVDIYDVLRSIGLSTKFIVDPDPHEWQIITDGYRFDRYINAADGLQKMCEYGGHKLVIAYIPYKDEYRWDKPRREIISTPGYISIGSITARHVSDPLEISQDSKIDFHSRDYRMGVNHLICLGTGKLKDRVVEHLYADSSGNISQTQSLFGMDEVAEVFENPTAESDTLISTGTERFKSLLNYKSFTAEAKYIDDINLDIGDTITGKDLITGAVVTKPIREKIVKITDGIATVSYTL